MRVFNLPLANDVELNADFISNTVPLKNILMYSITAHITGTPTGTFTIQISNWPDTNTTIPLIPAENWIDIASTPASDSGDIMWDANQMTTYNYVRVLYADGSSGSSDAVLSLVLNGKGA